MSRKYQSTSPKRISLRRKQITPILKKALDKGAIINTSHGRGKRRGS